MEHTVRHHVGLCFAALERRVLATVEEAQAALVAAGALVLAPALLLLASSLACAHASACVCPLACVYPLAIGWLGHGIAS